MRAVLVTPSNEVLLKDVDGYQDIKRLLNGGWLEAVTLGPDTVVYVDEDRISKKLQKNIVATFVVELMLHKYNRQLVPGSDILGNAVFIGMNTAIGEEIDLSESVIRNCFPSLVGEIE